MVQQVSLTALNARLEAIRVALFQLVTSKWGAVTAEAVSPRHMKQPPAANRDIVSQDYRERTSISNLFSRRQMNLLSM